MNLNLVSSGGSVEVSEAAFGREYNESLVHQVVVAHLAGAMAKPVWLLLPFVPDWRWFLEREDCPWYPTMRLFRQNTFDDWSEVFERLAAALRELVARR